LLPGKQATSTTAVTSSSRPYRNPADIKAAADRACGIKDPSAELRAAGFELCDHDATVWSNRTTRESAFVDPDGTYWTMPWFDMNFDDEIAADKLRAMPVAGHA
jgi:hypothetical protein